MGSVSGNNYRNHRNRLIECTGNNIVQYIIYLYTVYCTNLLYTLHTRSSNEPMQNNGRIFYIKKANKNTCKLKVFMTECFAPR